MKQEKIREKQLAEQKDARQQRAAEKKTKRNNRKALQMGLVDEVPKKA